MGRFDITFEILGISGKGYDFEEVKITIYLDPVNYSKQIRLLIKAVFRSIDIDFSDPIYIYLQSNRKIEIKNKEILDISERFENEKYSERIGAGESMRDTTPLKIKQPINRIIGENNRIAIELEPQKDEMDKIVKEIEIKQKENQDISKPKFGFLVDTIIQDEGIEKESLWKRLVGWSNFAWRFHFKVWSLIENIEPIEPIPLETGKRESGRESSFLNPSEHVQMFLVIPTDLFRSYGQIVAHPGEESMHIMTIRDKNTFIFAEKNKEEQEIWEKRVKAWVEEGAMAISWEYDQTASLSREAVVEHGQAYPRVWALLTFAFLLSVLVMSIFPQRFLCSLIDICTSAEKNLPPWIIVFLVLFVFAYFIANIYNFSFFELKKITGTKFLMIFLAISMLSLIVSIPLIINIGSFPEKFRGLTIYAFIIIVAVTALSLLKENQEIKIGKIKIRENEKISYLVTRTLVQFSAVFIAVLISTQFIDPEAITLTRDLFISLLSYVYGIVVGMESGPILIKHVFL